MTKLLRGRCFKLPVMGNEPALESGTSSLLSGCFIDDLVIVRTDFEEIVFENGFSRRARASKWVL